MDHALYTSLIDKGLDEGRAIDAAERKRKIPKWEHRPLTIEPHGSGRSYDLTHHFEGRSDGLLIGCELELEMPPTLGRTVPGPTFFSRAFGDMGKLVRFESDSSLNHGMECVFAPLAFNEWKMWYTTIHKAFKLLVAAGYRSHDTTTCGLHFHINREFNSEKQGRRPYVQGLGKTAASALHNLLHNLDPKSYHFWSKISRRDERSLQQYGSLQPGASRGAINLAKRETVELRLFRGTLRSESFFGALELAFALAEHVKTLNTDVNNGLPAIDDPAYLRWLSERSYYHDTYVYGQYCKGIRAVPFSTSREKFAAWVRSPENLKKFKYFHRIAESMPKAANTDTTPWSVYADFPLAPRRVRSPKEQKQAEARKKARIAALKAKDEVVLKQYRKMFQQVSAFLESHYHNMREEWITQSMGQDSTQTVPVAAARASESRRTTTELGLSESGGPLELYRRLQEQHRARVTRGLETTSTSAPMTATSSETQCLPQAQYLILRPRWDGLPVKTMEILTRNELEIKIPLHPTEGFSGLVQNQSSSVEIFYSTNGWGRHHRPQWSVNVYHEIIGWRHSITTVVAKNNRVTLRYQRPASNVRNS